MNFTYRYRVRDKHAKRLAQMAMATNTVWNYCNEAQMHAVKWWKKWPTAYELHRLTAGMSKELGISANSINVICTRYIRSRDQAKKQRLRWRGRKNLGWVPFKGENIKSTKTGFRVMGRDYRLWLSRAIPVGARLCDGGSFSQDGAGHWYLNVSLDIADEGLREPERRVGIDLGLKDFAALSNGEKIAARQEYRRGERALAKAQRARKRRLCVHLAARIKNRRRDFLHKVSTRIVREFDFIAVGDVNASGLKMTNMGKSVSDAGWSSFRNMLAYKAMAHGARYAEVDERYSTQACSDCGVVSGPKGRQGLVIRAWTCSSCGAVHDRDHNSAKFILRRGLATLLGESAQRSAG